MIDYIEKYKSNKDNLIKNKEDVEIKLEKALIKYEEIKNSDVDKKEARLQVAMKIVNIQKNALSKIIGELEFLRPANEEDIAYRLRQYDEFCEKISKEVPEDLPLRFHGCPIYTAKHILQDGEISSSVDRLGIETSYDTEGQISVTTRKTIDTTVRGYTDLVGNYNMPSGCIFVLLPKDEADEKIGNSLLMGNINFKDEPDRLVGIITSPENIENVKEWGSQIGIDSLKIKDFDDFVISLDSIENDITYSFSKKNDEFIEEWQHNLVDKENNKIGERTAKEIENIKTGKKEINVLEVIKGDNGILNIETTSVGIGDTYSEHSIMTVDNTTTGNKEKAEYIKNENGNEMYTYMENGVIGQKITKTDRGTTIDTYIDGKPFETYEYDENGKALIPMGKMDQLPKDYVEGQFRMPIPEYNLIPLEKEQITSDNVLRSAVEATEKNTKTSEIKNEYKNIENIQKENILDEKATAR